MQILCAGDTHGNIFNAKLLIDFAVIKECSEVIIVGDFGIWKKLEEYAHFVPELSKYSVKNGIKVKFIRGNHDDPNYLNELCEGKREVTIIAPNIEYCPNGSIWKYDDIICYAMGGAITTDAYRRQEGIDYFKNEGIQFEDVVHSSTVGHVDIIFSHDSPFSSDIDTIKDFRQGIFEMENRRNLQSICKMVSPHLCVHGHWHTYRVNKGNWCDDEGYHYFNIVALASNLQPIYSQIMVLDTESELWKM